MRRSTSSTRAVSMMMGCWVWRGGRRGAPLAGAPRAALGLVFHGVACVAQVVHHDGGDVGFVFDDEDAVAHEGLSSSGSCSVMRRPPRGEASAVSVPPCASTMARQIARPRPEPPWSRLREVSARYR